jgi:hypothetical protein
VESGKTLVTSLSRIGKACPGQRPKEGREPGAAGENPAHAGSNLFARLIAGSRMMRQGVPPLSLEERFLPALENAAYLASYGRVLERPCLV